jgi:hypothetical protein
VGVGLACACRHRATIHVGTESKYTLDVELGGAGEAGAGAIIGAGVAVEGATEGEGVPKKQGEEVKSRGEQCKCFVAV